MTGSLAGEVGRRLRQCSSLGIQGALEAVEPEADAYLKRIRVALDAAGASEEVRRRVRALWIASVAMYREPLGSPLRDALAEIRRDREMEPMDLLADEASGDSYAKAVRGFPNKCRTRPSARPCRERPLAVREARGGERDSRRAPKCLLRQI